MEKRLGINTNVREEGCAFATLAPQPKAARNVGRWPYVPDGLRALSLATLT